MPVTTNEQEYKRLRSYLNPYIKGNTTDAVLQALAAGNSSYLINNVAAVNDNLYIATASGQYLDQRLSDAGIIRPANVGLSDDIFRKIGIQVKNRKQVRDLINNLLDAIFGDQFVRATSNSGAVEPYNLQDQDTLIVNFDNVSNVTITFNTADFEDIAAAKAEEVADAISKSLSNQGFTGSAIAQNDGNGAYVQLISSTIGPVSSVTVFGGSAQNELLFDSVVPAGGNMSTQWTLSLQPGGVLRFTWTGGANPQIGKVSEGNYVNIYGGGFTASANEGSYTVVTAIGGAVGSSYFEVENPLATSGIVVQGSDTAILFYNPVRKTLLSLLSYAALFQPSAQMLQIFLPASTQVIRRSREGSAHLHDPPNSTWVFNANTVSGDVFGITTTSSLTAGANFAVGSSIVETVENIAAAVNEIEGLVAFPNGTTLLVIQNDATLTMSGSYTGSQDIVGSGPLGDVTSLAPNQPGPYLYDLSQPFVVSDTNTTLTQELDGTMSRVITVADSANFPDAQGYLIFDYGYETQEGPVPYIARPSDNTLLISPAYTIETAHANGGTVHLIAQKAPVSLTSDGSDYPFYITDVASGRIYAQDLIQSVAATGINIVFTILYPNDIGLGKWGTIYTENPQIWAE